MKQYKCKKLVIVLSISAVLLLSLGSWFYYQKNSFRLFCNNLFIEEISGDTLGLHYTLAYPEKFGIKKEEAALPLYKKELALESYRNLKECCSDLESFDPQKLSVEEQYTQQLLINSLSEELEGQQYFYLQEMFSPSGGIQIQYPILMAEYTFRCKQDIDDYLTLIKLTPSYFDSYCKFTAEKAKKGFCMPDYSLKKVIDQCNTIITSDDIENETHFLITTFNERVSKLIQDNIISKEEAVHYADTNKEYLSTYFLPAYTELSETMTTFLGMGKNNDGLCYFKDGQNYYSWLFARSTGSEVPLSEVYETLSQDYYNSMRTLRDDLLDFQSTASLTDEDFSYFSLSDSEDMLKNLTEQMAEDFPSIQATFDIPSFTATVKDVSTSLENFTAPAYYLVPPIDDNSQNSIYINQSSAPAGLELYTTLAHEGYPGHLYQTTYYQLYREKENLPYLRNTLNYGGYVEGWALYVEMLSFDYAANLLISDTGKTDYRLLYDIYKQERRASLAMLSLLDVGIHYYGFTFERVQELLANHGINNETTAREIYEYIVEEPGNYPKYYWSFLEILSLKEAAKETMGTNYSDYAFHQFFLESGPSDFTSLEARLSAYQDGE